MTDHDGHVGAMLSEWVEAGAEAIRNEWLNSEERPEVSADVLRAVLPLVVDRCADELLDADLTGDRDRTGRARILSLKSQWLGDQHD